MESQTTSEHEIDPITGEYTFRLHTTNTIQYDEPLTKIGTFGPCGLCQSVLPTKTTVAPLGKSKDFRWRRDPFHRHKGYDFIVCNNCYQKRLIEYNFLIRMGKIKREDKVKIKRNGINRNRAAPQKAGKPRGRPKKVRESEEHTEAVPKKKRKYTKDSTKPGSRICEVCRKAIKGIPELGTNGEQDLRFWSIHPRCAGVKALQASKEVPRDDDERRALVHIMLNDAVPKNGYIQEPTDRTYDYDQIELESGSIEGGFFNREAVLRVPICNAEACDTEYVPGDTTLSISDSVTESLTHRNSLSHRDIEAENWVVENWVAEIITITDATAKSADSLTEVGCLERQIELALEDAGGFLNTVNRQTIDELDPDLFTLAHETVESDVDDDNYCQINDAEPNEYDDYDGVVGGDEEIVTEFEEEEEWTRDYEGVEECEEIEEELSITEVDDDFAGVAESELVEIVTEYEDNEETNDDFEGVVYCSEEEIVMDLDDPSTRGEELISG